MHQTYYETILNSAKFIQINFHLCIKKSLNLSIKPYDCNGFRKEINE